MKLTPEQIEKVEYKIGEVQRKRMERSTELAEEEHHENCDLECCGSHEMYPDDDDDHCIHCSLSQKEIDNHNDSWWGCVDAAEGNDDLCTLYITIEEHLEQFLESNK